MSEGVGVHMYACQRWEREPLIVTENVHTSFFFTIIGVNFEW